MNPYGPVMYNNQVQNYPQNAMTSTVSEGRMEYRDYPIPGYMDQQNIRFSPMNNRHPLERSMSQQSPFEDAYERRSLGTYVTNEYRPMMSDRQPSTHLPKDPYCPTNMGYVDNTTNSNRYMDTSFSLRNNLSKKDFSNSMNSSQYLMQNCYDPFLNYSDHADSLREPSPYLSPTSYSESGTFPLNESNSPYMTQSMDDSGYSDDMTDVSVPTHDPTSYLRSSRLVAREPPYPPYSLQAAPYSMGPIPRHLPSSSMQPRAYLVPAPAWSVRPTAYAGPTPRNYPRQAAYRPASPSDAAYHFMEQKVAYPASQRPRAGYTQPIHHPNHPSNGPSGNGFGAATGPGNGVSGRGNGGGAVAEGEAPQMIVKGMPQYSVVKQRVEEAVSLKRSNVAAAKAMLNQLCEEFAHCHIVWMELSRLEMEQGNILQCREVVLRGLKVLPSNETLLEKRVKVEERLRNVDGVIDCAKVLLEMNNSRCVKSIVEAAIVVAKLGCGYKASALFNALLEHNLFTQGGVTLDYIRFVFKTEDYHKGLRMLKETLAKLTKHGPMWFFTFSALEQNHTVFWTRGDIRNRSNNRDLAFHLQQALSCLSEDLKWKVNYIAAQAQLRSFTHIRLWTRMKKRYLALYCETSPEVIRSCFDSLRCCVGRCPEDYKWKVWLLAGRVQALAGKRYSAIRCLVRSTEFAPERSTHAVCLELARILDFIGEPVTAGSVIQRNMLRFPEEWKLVLERINQLLRENHVKEAYQLNCESLKFHSYAGRLWSSMIQLTHQLYGSTFALRAFYSALEYVSRSGEVWCEGARIFMNPTSRHFNPYNAQRCLMFAVFFTPQYGDSFIEAIRLSMITSDELLMFGRSNNPCFLSALMTSRNYSAIINKCVYSDPNYGSCWFRAKLFPLGSAEEVAFRAIKFTAHEVAIVSNVYYDAMLAYAHRLKRKRSKAKSKLSAESVPFIPSYLREGNEPSKKETCKVGVRNSLFSYSFQPYQMVTTPAPLTVGKKLKILFGTSQIEA